MAPYLAGTASWFAAFGIQMVLVTYIATSQLHLEGVWLSLAQASTTLPALVFMLAGGAAADQTDTRRIMVAAHLIAIVPPVALAAGAFSGQLTFEWLIAFGLLAGLTSSFMMPAREAMLARVIGPATPDLVQRAVRYSLLAQFIAQILGMAFARTASVAGLAAIFCVQAALQAFGAYCSWRLRPAPPFAQSGDTGLRAQFGRIADGFGDVRRSPALFPVTILAFAIGVLFVGSFLVVLPVILRADFGAPVERVSTLQVAFWGGTIVSTFAIGAAGTIARKGRAIVFAISCGCAVLAAMSFPGPLWALYLLTFIWGLGAGVTITMARTIVQEEAPAQSRARVLSVYQLGFTGGLPLGALLAGPVTVAIGGRGSALAAAAAMALVLVLLLSFTRLWSLGSKAAA
jgi:MFS family permease